MQPYRPSSQMHVSMENEDPEDALLTGDAYAAQDAEAWNTSKMSQKVPPAYDGISSFFSFEELVEEWQTITSVEVGRRIKTRSTTAL